MGLIDIFNRRKRKALPAAIEKQNLGNKKEDLKEENTSKSLQKEKIRVFSEKRGNDISYRVSMDSSQGPILIGKLYERKDEDNDREDKSIKETVQEIARVMGEIKESSTEEELMSAKETAKNTLANLSTKNMQLELDEDIIKHIDEYEPEEIIDYNKLDKLVSSISDIKKMSSSEIIKYGEKLSGCLEKLDSIKTPQDAEDNKDLLIKYMKGKENILENPIIDANIQSLQDGDKLDEKTLVQIAKIMEKNKNEDGFLYSAYLKLEEKRILKKIVDTLYKNNWLMSSENIVQVRMTNMYIEYLKKQVNSTIGGFSPEILEYIIREVKQQNITTYMNECKSNDEQLYERIKDNIILENEENRETILEFLSARVECLGQLNYKGDKNIEHTTTLREFVEKTNFKDPDDTESKEFLYIIAQIAKEQIKTTYIPTINQYKEKESTKRNPFKDSIHYEVEPLNYEERKTTTGIVSEKTHEE